MFRRAEFLKDSEEIWLTGDVVESKVNATDPEVKVNVNVNVATEKNDMLSRLDRFPNLNTMKAAVTICLRYKKNPKEKAIRKKDELMNRKPESKKVEQRLESGGVEKVSAISW